MPPAKPSGKKLKIVSSGNAHRISIPEGMPRVHLIRQGATAAPREKTTKILTQDPET